jgi:hypothetical protein
MVAAVVPGSNAGMWLVAEYFAVGSADFSDCQSRDARRV